MPPRCKNPNKPDPSDTGWLHFCEPYAGGLSVLLANDPEGISEVVNDMNHSLTNFWCVLQGDGFGEFQKRLSVTPFSQAEYESSHQPYEPTWDKSGGMLSHAVNFFIHCRQSLAGRMSGFTGITRNRTRRGMNAEVSAWLNCIEGLPAVHERLKRVLILNKPALEVIKREDGPRSLFYLDPPYLHETRSTTSEYGDHEISKDDHIALLTLLTEIKGKFMLSGYPSSLYEQFAKDHGWNCHTFDMPNNAAGGKTKQRKTECLWVNY